MNKKTVAKAITLLGGPSAAAETLGVTRQIIWHWKARGISETGILRIEKALREKRYGNGNRKKTVAST